VEIPATGGMGLGTRLIAFRTDGSDAHFLIDRRDGGAGFSMADVLWVARDGSPRILLASQTSFYLSDEGFWPNVSMVDVATNTFSKLVWPREGVQDWYADRDGNVRLGIGIEKDGLRYRALYRASNKDNFDEFANVRRTEELIVPDVILADGSAIAFSTRSGTNAAYKLDLKTMQVGEKLFDAGAYDMSNLYLACSAMASPTRAIGPCGSTRDERRSRRSWRQTSPASWCGSSVSVGTRRCCFSRLKVPLHRAPTMSSKPASHSPGLRSKTLRSGRERSHRSRRWLTRPATEWT
jgi:hypothetical protein